MTSWEELGQFNYSYKNFLPIKKRSSGMHTRQGRCRLSTKDSVALENFVCDCNQQIAPIPNNSISASVVMITDNNKVSMRNEIDSHWGQARIENAELQQKVKELEAKLAELEPEDKVEEASEEEQAA